MAYELIETIEVGAGGASSIEFTSIPQDGVDLVCVVSGRIANGTIFNLTINSNTGSVYSQARLYGNGSTVGTTKSTGTPSSVYAFVPNDSTFTANTFSSNCLYFSNYTSNTNKAFSSDGTSENNATSAVAQILAGMVADTNPITSLKVFPLSSQTWVQYTTASLYKIY